MLPTGKGNTHHQTSQPQQDFVPKKKTQLPTKNYFVPKKKLPK